MHLPGLDRPAALNRLIDKFDWSSQTRQRLLTGEMLPEAKPFSSTGYNPLGEARERYLSGDRDEAIWLHFMATLIGWDRPDSVDRFLQVLGDGERATWRYVVERAPDALARVQAQGDVLMREAPFGNHRKYETHRGERGSSRVVTSFLNWAGSSPSARIDGIIAGVRGPEHAFDRLYNAFDVFRFGRTARYDFVRLVANVDRRLRPGSCYLRGASGPRRAAALLFLGRSWARDNEVAGLEEGLRELASVCGIDLTVVEDAICQWQKAIPPNDKRSPAVQLTLELKTGRAR
jgi:hypothetical protein